MKKTIIVLWSVIALWGCRKEGRGDAGKGNGDNALQESSRFLVDKIYDYHNNLIAEYIYDDNNRLVKRKFKDPETGASSDYDLQYENGKVKKISFSDYSHPDFNHDIVLRYNAEGQITRDEIYQGGRLTNAKNYSYYNNGKIKGIFDDANFEYCTVEYMTTDNAVKSTWRIRNSEDGDKDVIKTFTYDSNYKPDLGIGNVFQFDPFPQSNAASPFEKNISPNNMTGADDGTKWHYTYNEAHLPVTIETTWDNIEMDTPMLIRIQYKSKR